MKLTFKHILSAAAVSACAVTSQAQSTYSVYFLDNYMYSFEMNPAMVNMGKHGFVSMPAIGNLNIGMKGNLHVTDLLYNRDGKTVLFANPQVSAGEVLGNLSSANKIGIDTRIDIMSVGFKALGGQNVVSISAIADANVSAPKSIFSLIKEGISNRTYDIRDLRANATGYAQIQLNHQRDLSKWVPGLKAGAAFKMLLGMANVDARFNEAQLELGEDAWKARTQAEIYTNIKDAYYTLGHNDRLNRDYVDGLHVGGVGVNGFGIGFDLGATYKWRDFNFSLALLDLGFIS